MKYVYHYKLELWDKNDIQTDVAGYSHSNNPITNADSAHPIIIEAYGLVGKHPREFTHHVLVSLSFLHKIDDEGNVID